MSSLPSKNANRDGSYDLGELMRRAAEAIRNQPYPGPCEHLVSPKALHRPGVYMCHWCGAALEIPYPLSERA